MPSPSTAPPPPEVLARLLDEHASRFPEKATIGPLLGDDGARVSLPILLGNPKPGSVAFSDAIAAALNFRRSEDPTGDELVRACLLWPPRQQWDLWRERWAAIDGRVVPALAQKLGSNLAVLLEPAEGAEPPTGIAPSPAGLWRILRPHGSDPINICVEPPNDMIWRRFVKEATQPGADVAKVTRELAALCIKGSTMPVGDMFDRWPGLVVAVMQVLSELVGTGAEATLGFW